MAATENVWVKVDLIDRMSGRVFKASHHQKLVQSANSIRVRMEDMQAMDVMVDELERVLP